MKNLSKFKSFAKRLKQRVLVKAAAKTLKRRGYKNAKDIEKAAWANARPKYQPRYPYSLKRKGNRIII